jgi:ATP-binding cassette subfamily C protein
VVGLLVHRTVRAINGIQKSWQQAALSEHAFTLVASFLEESGAQSENEAGEIAPTLDQGCRFENVSFDYDKSPVLTNVSMEIPARQLTVIIGPSGTGKTTLADLLLGFYEPGKGQILIDRVPLNKINLRSWRHMVGYVPQELFLFRGTVLENVTLGDPKLTPEMAEQALKAAEAWDFVAKFPDGMYTHVGEKGTKLSGGERQRVAIARALVHRPKLLILDEATSALDLESEAAICANIQKLSRSITVLAVSHRAGWIDVADQVFELDSQKVDERGGQTGIDLAAQTV